MRNREEAECMIKRSRETVIQRKITLNVVQCTCVLV